MLLAIASASIRSGADVLLFGAHRDPVRARCRGPLRFAHDNSSSVAGNDGRVLTMIVMQVVAAIRVGTGDAGHRRPAGSDRRLGYKLTVRVAGPSCTTGPG